MSSLLIIGVLNHCERDVRPQPVPRVPRATCESELAAALSTCERKPLTAAEGLADEGLEIEGEVAVAGELGSDDGNGATPMLRGGGASGGSGRLLRSRRVRCCGKACCCLGVTYLFGVALGAALLPSKTTQTSCVCEAVINRLAPSTCAGFRTEGVGERATGRRCSVVPFEGAFAAGLVSQYNKWDKDAICLVTGGTQGIGRATVDGLARTSRCRLLYLTGRHAESSAAAAWSIGGRRQCRQCRQRRSRAASRVPYPTCYIRVGYGLCARDHRSHHWSPRSRRPHARPRLTRRRASLRGHVFAPPLTPRSRHIERWVLWPCVRPHHD